MRKPDCRYRLGQKMEAHTIPRHAPPTQTAQGRIFELVTVGYVAEVVAYQVLTAHRFLDVHVSM
jgi:hypothetical protein